MKKNLLQRAIIIAVVTLVGLYIVIGPRHRPSLKDFTWSGIKATLASNIHLGLDLKGGSHLVMRVKTEEFLKHLTEGNAVAAENAAKDAGFEVKSTHAETGSGNYRVVLEAADPSKSEDIKTAVQKKVEFGDTSVWTYSQSGNQLTWSMTNSAQRTLADNAATQAKNIIDSRINSLGITEPLLQTHGAQSAHQILLQMPGVQDPERVKNLLKGESRLELVHVVSPPSPAPSQTYATEAEAISSVSSGGALPANRRVLKYVERKEPTRLRKISPARKELNGWLLRHPPLSMAVNCEMQLRSRHEPVVPRISRLTSHSRRTALISLAPGQAPISMSTWAWS